MDKRKEENRNETIQVNGETEQLNGGACQCTRKCETECKCQSQNEDGNKEKKRGWSRYYITVEPIKFAVGFVLAFTSGVTIDLLERNVFLRNYNLSLAEWSSGNFSKDIKSMVEGETAQVNMINNCIQGIFPFMLNVFIGPWSDKNGRKPFILWSLRGYVVYYFLWSVLSFFPQIPVQYFFIPSVLLGLTGGAISFLVCTGAYICDNFHTDDRTMRLSIINGAFILGNVLGNTGAEHVVALGGEYGFQLVFSLSFLMALLALLYSTYILEDTVQCSEKERTRLIDFKHVKSMVKHVLISPAKGRVIVTLVLLILATEIPVWAADEAFLYLVGKSQYNWTLGRYTIFAALCSLISGVVPVLGIWFFMEICGLKNTGILIISCALLLVLEVCKALSVTETMYWIVTLTSKANNMVGSAVDSELADAVAEKHIGKAFTFVSMMDSLSPLVSIPVYTQLYTVLLPDRTLYIYFLSLALTAVTLTSSIGLTVKKKFMYDRVIPPETSTEEETSVPLNRRKSDS